MRRPNGMPAPPPMPQSQPVLSAGGKANPLSFNLVLHKLQVSGHLREAAMALITTSTQHELEKSKETGGALQNLTNSMTDIQDTLGGAMPPAQNGSAAQFIPPQFRSASPEAQAALAGPHGQQAAAFISLQNQLTDTQTSLNGHLDKVRQLEDQLREHEAVKEEISSMKAQMEDSRREMELILANARGRQIMRNFPGDVGEDDEDGGEDDEDDSRSTITLLADDHGKRRSSLKPRENGDGQHGEADGRPQVNGNGDGDKSNESSREDAATLDSRIQNLTSEVAEAVAVSRTLQTQHEEAMSAVKLLTERVGVLETGIQSRVAEEVSRSEQKWETWRVKFEEGWRKERESWNAERERLRGVVREWEEASRRAHEEDEERELNESLSEDELIDEDVEDGEAREGELLSLEGLEWQASSSGLRPRRSSSSSESGSGSGSMRKANRRRRPSNRAALAVSALQGVVGDMAEPGSTTPRAPLNPLEGNTDDSASPPAGPLVSRIREKARAGRNRGSMLARTTSSGTFKSRLKKGAEKDSSESGKESQDTLKESDESGSGASVGRRKKGRAGENQGGIQVSFDREPISSFSCVCSMLT